MKKPLLLDGPMGTEINRRGGNTALPLWSARAVMENPELVKQIHLDYISAGSDIITTNTFRTQSYTLQKAGLSPDRAAQVTSDAVKIAKLAREESTHPSLLIAGSIAPIEDCYSPQLVPENNILENEHAIMTEQLYTNGVDVFLIETMNTIREAEIAVSACSNYEIPVFLGFTADDVGQILSGENWDEVHRKFAGHVDILLVNCTSYQGTLTSIKRFEELGIEKWGFYPNFGEIDSQIGWTPSIVPETYTAGIGDLIHRGPSLIGTCCGATPDETEKLRKLLDAEVDHD